VPHANPEVTENRLLQSFRVKAPTFAGATCPDRKATDQWLFLAQHFGLPTRLLDWTDGALLGLYFALCHCTPIVWMLDAAKLNELSLPPEHRHLAGELALTWYRHDVNIAAANIGAAWTYGSGGTRLPVAIHPTFIHPRMSSQRSCFTVHGQCKQPLIEQVPELLTRFEIDESEQDAMRKHLRRLGVGHSTVWPELDGLAKELSDIFWARSSS
jgi:hypothetical protein